MYLGVVEGMKGETERKQVGLRCEDVVININDHVLFLSKEQIQVLECLRHHVRVHPVNNSSIQKGPPRWQANRILCYLYKILTFSISEFVNLLKMFRNVYNCHFAIVAAAKIQNCVIVV